VIDNYGIDHRHERPLANTSSTQNTIGAAFEVRTAVQAG